MIGANCRKYVKLMGEQLNHSIYPTPITGSLMTDFSIFHILMRTLGTTGLKCKCYIIEFIFFVQDLNQKWASLQQLTSERATQLGSAHEVQRFHRDVDETKDWIQEKDEALNNDDLGKDLRSVQALQRKHEGLERDLAALGDKVTNCVSVKVYLLHIFKNNSTGNSYNHPDFFMTDTSVG